VRTNWDLVLGGGPTHPYDGLLDEVSIYSRALSQAEIQAIYNAGSIGKCLAQPIINGIQPTTNGVALSWVSKPGLTYRIQSEGDLSSPSWTDASGDITASDTTTSATMRTNSAPQQFYRLKILQ
jgi:hypothetical protein